MIVQIVLFVIDFQNEKCFLIYKVESWPCDIRIPNLTTSANQQPGSAVLGKK
jgi:nicotinamidase-related amidase